MRPEGLFDPHLEYDACGVGFVVDVKGRKSHQIVQQALNVLVNLRHRGACGCEKNTGDGAGILLQIPHNFLKQTCRGLGIHLPSPGEYGVGTVYLPPKQRNRKVCETAFEKIIKEEGQHFLGWRTVPTDNGLLGATAKSCEPVVRQIFIGRSSGIKDDLAFERKLYVIRKRAENAIRYGGGSGGHYFYIPSLSFRTFVF